MAKKLYVKRKSSGPKLRLRPKLTKKYTAGQALPNGFVVDGVVASGGSGSVLKAHKTAINPPIYKAIKVISGESSGGRSTTQKEFHAEARISSLIGSDPYCVAVEDIIELPDGSTALIFPFIEGQTLFEINAEHLAAGHLFPVDLTAFVFHRLLSVLDYARSKGVPHRDLCTNNVILQRTGVPMLLDWGAAAEINRDLIIGKPSYIAPEIVKCDESMDSEDFFAADIFSLGALIREMLTGVNDLAYMDPTDSAYDPYEALEYRQKLDTDTIAPVSHICSDIPLSLCNIVRACMAERPADRPTAEDLYDYLGKEYLNTPQVGFGVDAEVLKVYLENSGSLHRYDEALPDDKTGRLMARIVDSRMRETARIDPIYEGMTHRQIAAELGVDFNWGNVYRHIEDAYGTERVEAAFRGILIDTVDARHPNRSRNPNSFFEQEIQAEVSQINSMDSGQLRPMLTDMLLNEMELPQDEIPQYFNRLIAMKVSEIVHRGPLGMTTKVRSFV